MIPISKVTRVKWSGVAQEVDWSALEAQISEFKYQSHQKEKKNHAATS
jgi:hypothetical protein